MESKRRQGLSQLLKAVIGYWIEYYYSHSVTSVTFMVGSQRVMITEDGDGFYLIKYKWLSTPVHDTDIFDSLNLYEAMLKGMD